MINTIVVTKSDKYCSEFAPVVVFKHNDKGSDTKDDAVISLSKSMFLDLFGDDGITECCNREYDCDDKFCSYCGKKLIHSASLDNVKTFFVGFDSIYKTTSEELCFGETGEWIIYDEITSAFPIIAENTLVLKNPAPLLAAIASTEYAKKLTKKTGKTLEEMITAATVCGETYPRV